MEYIIDRYYEVQNRRNKKLIKLNTKSLYTIERFNEHVQQSEIALYSHA